MLVGDALGAGDQLVERRGDTFGAGLGEQGIDAAEVDERDRGLAVLGLGPAVRDHAANRAGHAARPGRSPSSGGSGSIPPLAPEASFSRRPPSLASPKISSGSVAAVSSLTRISPASAPDSIATVRVTPGPVSSSSRCDSPTRKKS